MSKIYDGELIRFGWRSAVDHIGFLIGGMVVTGLAILVPLIIGALLIKVHVLLFLIALLVAFVLTLVTCHGWLAISIKLADGQPVAIGDIFRFTRIWSFIGVTIVYSFLVMVGTFFFVIPGVILSLKFLLAPYYVVDRGMGVMDALKASDAATMGYKWDLLGLNYTVGAMVQLGALAFGVGLLVTMPAGMIANAKAYRALV